ncbi:MAG: PAC2 family protein, partial [Candidatus Diapherotrites archaeon]|nr:PAC2 family protein [Candidatus Diapherotrites archaeon]
FPPSAHTKDGLIDMIKDELHAYKYKSQDFVFLTGPVQPSLDFRVSGAKDHYEFATEIVKAAKQLGVKRIIALAGINIGNTRMEKKHPDIVVAAANRNLLQEFSALGAKVDKKEGLISGAAGLIPGIGEQFGIEAVCLMGETNAQLIYGDHGAAKQLIELLVRKFGFKVDMHGIEKEAKAIEEAFEKLAKQFEEQEEEKPCTEGPSYVR